MRLGNGKLRAAALGPEEYDYPGIDIEYIPDDDDGSAASLPGVRVELVKDTGELRVVVWNDPEEEDFTEEIHLTNIKK